MGFTYTSVLPGLFIISAVSKQHKAQVFVLPLLKCFSDLWLQVCLIHPLPLSFSTHSFMHRSSSIFVLPAWANILHMYLNPVCCKFFRISFNGSIDIFLYCFNSIFSIYLLWFYQKYQIYISCNWLRCLVVKFHDLQLYVNVTTQVNLKNETLPFISHP